LEVALLDDEQVAPAPSPAAAVDEHARLTVLVVAQESDVRRHVRECLRERKDVHVLEASTVTAAVALAERHSLALFIVDEPERDLLRALPNVRAIVLVDEVPLGEPESGTSVRLLGRPFTTEGLMAEVDRLLG
jgi:hypothetical protein